MIPLDVNNTYGIGALAQITLRELFFSVLFEKRRGCSCEPFDERVIVKMTGKPLFFFFPFLCHRFEE